MKVLDRVSMLLQQKGRDIYSVASDESVYAALSMMADKDVGALLVINDGRLVGMISERDYARKVILRGKSSRETLVGEIMTHSPITISCDAPVEEAMRTMTDHRIRHLPVLDSEERLIGVVSIGDLVSWIMRSQDEVIAHLEHYITGDLLH